MSFAKRGSIIAQDSMTRRERALQQHKGNKVTTGFGLPQNKDGAVGDISIRTVADGVRCYIKIDSGWRDVNTMVPATQLTWHEMDLDNNWVRHSATASYLPSYTKDANGFIHFRGAVNSGDAADDDITLLPEAFTPNITVTVPVATADSTTPVASLRVYGMDASSGDQGKVSCNINGDTDLVSLDGVSFYAGETIVGSTSVGGSGGSAAGSYGGGGGGGGGG